MSARESYLHEFGEHLTGRLPESLRRQAVDEARTALDEAFEGMGRQPSRDEIEEAFGSPLQFADALAGEIAARATAEPEQPRRRAEGDVLGVPWGARPLADAQTWAERLWNPRDPRLLMPRVFGIGWDVNFGALAVKLGLLRPDDVDDATFERVPRGLTAGLAWASVATLALAAAYALVSAPHQPPRIPTHFGVHGPDSFASPLLAAAQYLGVAAVPVLLIAWRVFLRRASGLARVLGASGSVAIVVIMVGGYANAVSWASRGRYLLPSAVPVVGGLALLFGLLLGLSKLGLRAEWRDSEAQGSGSTRG